MEKLSPSKKAIAVAIRGSVPDGKLKRARVVLSDKRAETIGGFTEYRPEDKSVKKIGVPVGIDAYSLAVQSHETGHATFDKPRRKKPVNELEAMAGQAVDDAWNEQRGMQKPLYGNLKKYRRDRLAAANRDLAGCLRRKRAVKAGQRTETTWDRNFQLISSVRGLAMAMAYGLNMSADKPEQTSGYKLQNRMINLLGSKTFHAIRGIVQMAQSKRAFNRCVSLLSALLERETDPEFDNDFPIELPPDIDGDMLLPVSHGDAEDGHMEVRPLKPMTAYCSKERRVAVRFRPSGVNINPSRFVNAVASGDAAGLFRQRIRLEGGGTVVIDASGSMGATCENLSALCALIPTATVAYYSGNERGRGILSVFAEAGRRYNGELPHETLKGGNAVDLPALQWLFNHPQPWTFISDLDFCGGVLGSEMIAHALVDRHLERGDLTLYRSLDAAFEAYGGVGELHDARSRKTK